MPASKTSVKGGRSTTDAIRGSVRYHAGLVIPQEVPFTFSNEEIKELAKRWPKTKFCDILGDFDRWYQVAVDGVVKTSSSGCNAYLGPTKGAALLRNPDLVKMLTFQRFLRYATTSNPEIFTKSPMQLIEEGFCDPLRFFLKCEAHAWKKRFDKETEEELPEKRWRLISSVSLVDELFDHLIYNLMSLPHSC